MYVKLKFAFCFLLVGIFFNTAIGAQKSILPIQSWTTKTGSTVLYVHETGLPIVDIQLVFDAGSARDGIKAGIAKMTNDSLIAGTNQHNANSIASAFDDVGALYSSAVNRDMAVVALRSLTDAKYFQPAFSMFTEVLTNPTFPESEFKRIQKQTLLSLTQQDEQPASIVGKAFYHAIYGSNPYGHPVTGTKETVSTFTDQDLRNFYKDFYTAKNAMITIVGNIDKTKATSIAETLSGSLSLGKKLDTLISKPYTANNRQLHVAFPSSQTHVIIGQVGINRNDTAYFPAMVGNYILGGGGLTSRLFDEVREKRGLVYTVHSQFSALMDRGPFAVELQTRNSEAKNAIQVVNQTIINFLANGPSDREVTSAKKNLTQGFILRLASNSAIAAQLVNIGFYKLPLNYLDTYQSSINKVSAQQIQATFNHIIKPNELITITVGNNHIEPPRKEAIR